VFLQDIETRADARPDREAGRRFSGHARCGG
jgi:hypothetical protein